MSDEIVLRRETQLALPQTGVADVVVTRCWMCRRRLKAARWVRLGIGPKCAEKHPDVLRMLTDRADRVDAAITA